MVLVEHVGHDVVKDDPADVAGPVAEDLLEGHDAVDVRPNRRLLLPTGSVEHLLRASLAVGNVANHFRDEAELGQANGTGQHGVTLGWVHLEMFGAHSGALDAVGSVGQI